MSKNTKANFAICYILIIYRNSSLAGTKPEDFDMVNRPNSVEKQ